MTQRKEIELMTRMIGLLLIACGCLAAQSEPEKATVPLHDPSRPAQIHAQLMIGGITVRGYDGREVLVEAHARGDQGGRRTQPARADGMRRLDLPGNAGLEVVEEDNVVNIQTSSMHEPVDLVITTPRHSSLNIKCMNDGDIVVDHIDGEIDANNLNGKVTLKNVSGSVLAHSLNGEVTVSLDRVDGSKPMSFSTMNGDIDVTLPADVKANVRVKTDHGEIYSDYDLKLSASAVPESESGKQKDGSYRLRYDRSMRGTINGGGPEYQFTSFNGQIYIRRRK
jgi:hypothetical protein